MPRIGTIGTQKHEPRKSDRSGIVVSPAADPLNVRQRRLQHFEDGTDGGEDGWQESKNADLGSQRSIAQNTAHLRRTCVSLVPPTLT
jgi:hypothetical protein